MSLFEIHFVVEISVTDSRCCVRHVFFVIDSNVELLVFLHSEIASWQKQPLTGTKILGFGGAEESKKISYSNGFRDIQQFSDFDSETF